MLFRFDCCCFWLLEKKAEGSKTKIKGNKHNFSFSFQFFLPFSGCFTAVAVTGNDGVDDNAASVLLPLLVPLLFFFITIITAAFSDDF